MLTLINVYRTLDSIVCIDRTYKGYKLIKNVVTVRISTKNIHCMHAHYKATYM